MDKKNFLNTDLKIILLNHQF